MDNKKFKKTFNQIAKANGFETAFNGWFKESNECIFVIDLMKSNFGNYYQVTVKVYIQGTFGNNYIKSRDLLRDIGDISRCEPKQFEGVLNLEGVMTDHEREEGMNRLFVDFIVPFSEKALTKLGIVELVQKHEVSLLSSVKEELEKLISRTL